jgi:3-phenylpropionate/trans-cinnamate dioxygenase ferredoxin reductase subunit
MTGLSEGYDRLVVRGDIASRSVAFFYLRDGKLIAADCISRISEFMQSKRLIAARCDVDVDKLCDDSRPFKEIAAELMS